jgi:hypothetical protein
MSGPRDEDPTLLTPVDLSDPGPGGPGRYERTVTLGEEGTPSGIRAPQERSVPQTVALSSGEHARLTGDHTPPPTRQPPTPRPGPTSSEPEGGGELMKALALGAAVFVLMAAAGFALVWALF